MLRYYFQNKKKTSGNKIFNENRFVHIPFGNKLINRFWTPQFGIMMDGNHVDLDLTIFRDVVATNIRVSAAFTYCSTAFSMDRKFHFQIKNMHMLIIQRYSQIKKADRRAKK